jgi:hypothetical protein
MSWKWSAHLPPVSHFYGSSSDAGPKRDPAKHGGTADETTSSEIPAGTPNPKMAEQNPTLALPFTAITGAEKALASDGFIIEVPPMFKLAIFVLIMMLIIWYDYEFIRSFRRSSGSEDRNTVIPMTAYPRDFIRGSIEANYYNTQAE